MCNTCRGEHHWIERTADPAFRARPAWLEEGTETQPGYETNVKRFDEYHDTLHQLLYFACKHCSAWAEEGAFDGTTVRRTGHA